MRTGWKIKLVHGYNFVVFIYQCKLSTYFTILQICIAAFEIGATFNFTPVNFISPRFTLQHLYHLLAIFGYKQ